jgi:hypothetical protein
MMILMQMLFTNEKLPAESEFDGEFCQSPGKPDNGV